MSKEVIVPIGTRVLISREAPEEKSAGGIILSDNTKKAEYAAETRATIVAVGPEAWQEVWQEGSRCAVGQNVIIRKYSGAGVDMEKYGDVLVNDVDIIARVD
jgi:chaperonin GroES